MSEKREGLGARLWKGINRVIRDNGTSWREPPLPGLGPDSIEKANQRGWTAYHAKTDRIAAERLPKEMPAPVTWHDGIVREGQSMARHHADELQWEARHSPPDERERLMKEAQDILKREGLDPEGKPLPRRSVFAAEMRQAEMDTALQIAAAENTNEGGRDR